MTDVSALLEQVPSLPDTDDQVDPDWATGRIGAVHTWWRERAGVSAPIPGWIDVFGNREGGLGGGLHALDALDATVVVPFMGTTSNVDDIAARAVIASFSNREASLVCHQPLGMPDVQWMALATSVREQCTRMWAHRGEPLTLLDVAASPAMSFATGTLIAASHQGRAVLLDDLTTLAAALIVDRLGYRAKVWWGWASTSEDPARQVAADRLGLDPLLDLDVSDPQAMGARAVIALLELRPLES